MKNRKTQFRSAVVLVLGVLSCVGAYAQITPSADAFTNTSDPNTKYGANALLDVNGATEVTYIQFNLGSIPATASVSQATLKLYVNAVSTAGNFNVNYVNGTWVENTIDASDAPPVGATIASNVAITAKDKNQYILINVTPAVQAWLSGSETNNGIALVANGSFAVSFDSKENATTSHPAELDIAFAGGDGTITGVTTSSGSGLTGGGTSGTLNLSLTGSCATSQVLQWNGTAWACANSSGSGTITGVTAGTDLTGGGTSGNVTLNLNTSALNAAYAQLAVANLFTANQTVNGTLAATFLTPGGTAITGNSFNGQGVSGMDTGDGYGVFGQSNSGLGVYGGSLTFPGVSGASASNDGVSGFSESGEGVNGLSLSGTGVEGDADSTSAYGVLGNNSASGGGIGVYGVGYYGVSGAGYAGVQGITYDSTGGWGVYGLSEGTGVGGGFYNTSTGDALYAANQHTGSYAAFFLGNVDVDGNLSKAGGSFKIDHPLDPENKYLYHSFVESPDMKNIYDGNVTTDGSGLATVTLQDWFEALNRDFRYQLTVIGQFAQAMVASEISDHQFTIKTDKPNVKVSWQVTGIRQDAWANAHRIPVEESKEPADQGLYLHPELFGAPPEKSIALAHHPKPPKLQEQAPKLPKQDPRILKLQEQQANRLKGKTK